jgi:hypothetical protein
LNTIQHDSAESPESADPVAVELRTDNSIIRHNIPRGVLIEKTLIDKSVSESQSVSIQRDIVTPIKAKLAVGDACPKEFRGSDQVTLRPDSPGRAGLSVSCVEDNADTKFGIDSSVELIQRNYPPFTI